MSQLTDPADIKRLRLSGRQLARILTKLQSETVVGVTPQYLDRLARQLIADIGGRPAFLHYRPPGAGRSYPAALCVSVNDEIVHGVPTDRPLAPGDVVSLDLGLDLAGLITDMAVTVALPPVNSSVRQLLTATNEALLAGIQAARSGGRVGDIGAAVESRLAKANYGLIRELTGHGVGLLVHDEPAVPNFGPAGRGPILKTGQVLAIEPMAALGRGEIKLKSDGFTFATKDGSLSAHFEHTILINPAGVEIITQDN